MTDQTQRDDLVERLRRVESGSPRGEFTLNWYRNPDGPEAADRIERLERALRTARSYVVAHQGQCLAVPGLAKIDAALQEPGHG